MPPKTVVVIWWCYTLAGTRIHHEAPGNRSVCRSPMGSHQQGASRANNPTLTHLHQTTLSPTTSAIQWYHYKKPINAWRFHFVIDRLKFVIYRHLWRFAKTSCIRCNTSCYGCPNYHHYCLNHASNPSVNQVLIKLKKIIFIFNSTLQSKSSKFLV
jgi:hypothetical protein